jgi:glycosyltransferase involved in cell wall biosynthesis
MHDVMAVHYGKFTEFIDPTNLSVPKKFNYKIHALKLFVTFRGHYNPLRNMAIRHYLNYADKIFAVSDALKQVLNANRIYNVEVIHNGIRLVDWNSSVEEVLAFKKKHGLVGKKVILFSGWSTAAKGGDQLLQSLEKIVAEVPEVVLVAAGRTDIYYTSMRETALRRGLSHYIVFPGWLAGTESIAAYMSADVVVFPSICMDTFGMVNLEAMASKKPLVSTCFGGASEIVVDGVTGYIVNPYDFETMARRISMLLIDSHRANEFGQAGYDRVKRYFVKDDKMRDIVSWYTR